MLKKLSDCKRVLRVMIEGHRDWYATYDFVGDKFGTFLSHRGPARISELSLKYPEMIEVDRSKQNVNAYRYRFKFEDSSEFIKTLPDYLSNFIEEEMIRCKRVYTKEVQHVIYSDDGSVKVGKKLVEVNR